MEIFAFRIGHADRLHQRMEGAQGLVQWIAPRGRWHRAPTAEGRYQPVPRPGVHVELAQDLRAWFMNITRWGSSSRFGMSRAGMRNASAARSSQRQSWVRSTSLASPTPHRRGRLRGRRRAGRGDDVARVSGGRPRIHVDGVESPARRSCAGRAWPAGFAAGGVATAASSCAIRGSARNAVARPRPYRRSAAPRDAGAHLPDLPSGP